MSIHGSDFHRTIPSRVLHAMAVRAKDFARSNFLEDSLRTITPLKSISNRELLRFPIPVMEIKNLLAIVATNRANERGFQ